MRPIIDLNNLSYSKETLIYYTRGNILMRILIMAGLIAASIYCLIDNKYWIALLVIGVFLFQIPYLIKSIKRIDEIQFRINSKGIQYQDQMLEPWDNIENERVICVRSKNNDEGDDYFFIYYIKDSGQVMNFKMGNFSIGTSELEHCLYIHRGRFEHERAAKM